MKKRSIDGMRTLSLFAAMFAFGFGASAEGEKASATLAWADDTGRIRILAEGGKELKAELGMDIPSGATVLCAGSGAELLLEANGSVVRVARNTVFKLDSLAPKNSGKDDVFSLVSGKMRMLAKGKSSGGYTVRAGSVVCGVRGTDFARSFDQGQGKDWLCVLDGAVQASDVEGRNSILVGSKSFADFTKGFSSAPADDTWIRNNFSDIGFVD